MIVSQILRRSVPLFSKYLQFTIALVILSTHTTIVASDSQSNRKNKTLAITGQLLGHAGGTSSSSGATVGLHLTQDTILYADYTHGLERLLWFELESTSASIGVKNFVSNSFYYRLGLGARKFEMRTLDFDFADLFTVEEQELGYATSAFADFVIGNQWQWDYFTLGCDWIGTSQVIKAIDSKTYTNTEDASYEERKNSWEEIANMNTGHLLRLYLGFSL